MKYKKIQTNTIFFCLLALLLSICTAGIAQQKATATHPGSMFANGTIISSDNATVKSQPRMANTAYDEYIFAVYNESPTAVNGPMIRTSPFVSNGITYVKCNTENGKIKKGDLITSSSTAGEGMKATKSGMIIGIALEDADGTSGLVKIRVSIQYVKQ